MPPAPTRRSLALLTTLLGACGGAAAPVDPVPPSETDPHTDTVSEPTLDTDLALLPTHRLSARELQNTFRDALGVDVEVSAWMPEDVQVGGFDHLDGASPVSAEWVDALYTVAREVAARIDVPPDAAPPTTRFELQAESLAWSEGVPHASSLVSFAAVWATDRSTATRIELPAGSDWFATVWMIGAADGEQDLEATVSIDEVSLGTVRFERGTGSASVSLSTDGALAPGWHELVVTLQPDGDDRPPFVRDSAFPEGRHVAVDEIHFVASTPLPAPTPPPRPPLLVCDGEGPLDDACADDVIGTLTQRLWRRPVQAEELVALRAVYDEARTGGDTATDAMREVVVALVISPSFVYRREIGPGPNLPPDPFALASRLSYGVWGSAPDEELLACAASGQLSPEEAGPCGQRAQVDRLLADPRAAALVDDLAMRWLGVHDLDRVWIRAPSHPRWTADLFADLKAETRALIETARQDRTDLRDLLTVSESTASWRVAVLYGQEPTTFVGANPLDLAALERPGLLAQGSVLAASAKGSEPTAVDRAVWVMRELLCREPPAPPVDIPLLPFDQDPRDALAAHVSAPGCASCHAVIDPLGAPLDGFDLLGARTDDDREVTLPGPVTIDSVTEYAVWLRAQPELTACFTTRVASWVLGRELHPEDTPALEAITARAEADGFDLDSLVRAVVESPLFLEGSVQP